MLILFMIVLAGRDWKRGRLSPLGRRREPATQSGSTSGDGYGRRFLLLSLGLVLRRCGRNGTRRHWTRSGWQWWACRRRQRRTSGGRNRGTSGRRNGRTRRGRTRRASCSWERRRRRSLLLLLVGLTVTWSSGKRGASRNRRNLPSKGRSTSSDRGCDWRFLLLLVLLLLLVGLRLVVLGLRGRGGFQTWNGRGHRAAIDGEALFRLWWFGLRLGTANRLLATLDEDTGGQRRPLGAREGRRRLLRYSWLSV